MVRFFKGSNKPMLDGNIVHMGTLTKMKKMNAEFEAKSHRYLENSVDVMGSPMPFDDREIEFFETRA